MSATDEDIQRAWAQLREARAAMQGGDRREAMKLVAQAVRQLEAVVAKVSR